MSTPKVDNYAAANDCSNREAKRRLKRSGADRDTPQGLPRRGVPVAGTGKPKGE